MAELAGRGALVVSGPLGLGHAMATGACTSVLSDLGWSTRAVNGIELLGSGRGRVGEAVFRRLTSVPTVYDGLHFAHLRTGSRLAATMDRLSADRLVPALRRELRAHPADLVVAVFATAASAASQLKEEDPGLRTMVLCTDVAVHSVWVHEGIDLFLVTSPAAAASVRRFRPRAAVSVVPPPVRAAFYEAPTQQAARATLGVPESAPCVLLMGGGWGLGPLAEAACALVDAGICVLAVAGRNVRLAGRLRALAVDRPGLRAYGFSDRVPELMAASDVVVTTPGATTCGEARVVDRPLLLLDAVPGHGRDNLLHELELGGAEVAGPHPDQVVRSVAAMLDRLPRPRPEARQRDPAEWARAFSGALDLVGLSGRSGCASARSAPGAR